MLKTLFEGLRMGEGRVIPLAEIDEYLNTAITEYPGIANLRIDMDLIGIRKLAYLFLTQNDRLKEAHDNGKVIVVKYPANPTDIYYGCGVIPVDPFFAGMAQLIFKEDYTLASEGREDLAPEACAWQAVGNAAIRRKLFPVDAYAVFVGPWCTNSPYNGENLSDVIPVIHFLDHPFFPHSKGKEKNALDYMVKELESFVRAMERLTEKKVKKADLIREIRFHNQLRRRIREFHDLLLLENPPISGLDFILAMVLCDNWLNDPVAAYDTLETILAEARDRAERGIRGKGIKDDPLRIFFAGITTSELSVYNLLEDLGATLAGLE